MKHLLTVLMLGNAAVFVFGRYSTLALPSVRSREPVIVGATVVEMLCALALVWGAAAVMKGSPLAWRCALIANLVVIAGVAFGGVALAVGAGPRTASNDLYHKIMLALAVASIVILVLPGGAHSVGETLIISPSGQAHWTDPFGAKCVSSTGSPVEIRKPCKSGFGVARAA